MLANLVSVVASPFRSHVSLLGGGNSAPVVLEDFVTLRLIAKVHRITISLSLLPAILIFAVMARQ